MKKIFSKNIFKRILWKFARPFSSLLFFSHNLFYKNPITKNPLTNSIDDYLINFKNSVLISEHTIANNKTFQNYPPNFKFIEKLAFEVHNVLKDKKNSYIHGYILNSYLKKYIDKLFSGNEYPGNLNIIDIGTARGFSSLCLAIALDEHNCAGKIFTFDVIPSRKKIFWNSPSDLKRGKLTRIQLLQKWNDLVNKYIIFFSTATFNSMNIVDIPIINFGFVDGSHNFKDVIFEIEYIIKRLNKEAILIFDDYDSELFPGVVKACDYLFSLNLHSNCEFIKIQNQRKIVIFTFGDF